MGNQYHHVCIHGHFYQPPRENPWLGCIEEQPSAAPYSNWNERIAAECYGRLPRCRLLNEDHEIESLFDALPYLSFNFGPTLLTWLAQHRPELLARIRAADETSCSLFGGRGGAMAQAYNHPILPLCNTRDRHTQIHWGLEVFRHVYGRPARGMWLPETAIDMNTVRNLIDHGIRYVILAPRQAGGVRRFGEERWTHVAGGAVNPRFPYRVFEVDGGGKTHHDRYLDVFFYAPGLSLKVSFEHLLRDPARFEQQIRSELDEDAALAQIITLATDGEIYGHHEPDADRTLAHFLARTAPDTGLHVVNLDDYLAQHPPCWEAKLDLGPDGEGSSWSCEHGIGRWIRDCGCDAGAPQGWTQAWRTPLRAAFDGLRDHVQEVFRREGGRLFQDCWDARDDYIRVLLTSSIESRDAFLARHQERALSAEERRTAWRLLEASRYAMLMYTSCAWFFSDISGIEPVQNMRYALRAIELIQPWCEQNLTDAFCAVLREARSNISSMGSGEEIFRSQVLPSRYTPETIAATYAMAHMLELPLPTYAYTIIFAEESRKTKRGIACSTGRLCLHDPLTDETWNYVYRARGGDVMDAGVLLLPATTDTPPPPLSLELDLPNGMCVRLETMPLDMRKQFAHNLQESLQQEIRQVAQKLFERWQSSLQNRLRCGIEPDIFQQGIICKALETRLLDLVHAILTRKAVTDTDHTIMESLQNDAFACGAELPRATAAELIEDELLTTLEQTPAELPNTAPGWILQLLEFARIGDLAFNHHDRLANRFWDLIDGWHLRPTAEKENDTLCAIGQHLGFNADAVRRALQP